LYTSESAMRFRAKHFSVFIASIFLGTFSCALVLVLAMGTYLERADLNSASKWMFSAILIVSSLQTFFCLKILRGYPRWGAGMVLVFASCLLVSAPAIAYDPNFGLYASTLSMPLIGLYCLNSERYREMLQAAESIRVEKAAGPQPKLKTSRRQTAINNRLRAKSEKPFVVTKCGITILKWTGRALSFLFIVVVVVKLYLFCQGLVTGVVVGASRYGASRSYTFVDEPWMFALSMFLHLLAIGVCGLFLRLMLLLRE